MGDRTAVHVSSPEILSIPPGRESTFGVEPPERQDSHTNVEIVGVLRLKDAAFLTAYVWRSESVERDALAGNRTGSTPTTVESSFHPFSIARGQLVFVRRPSFPRLRTAVRLSHQPWRCDSLNDLRAGGVLVDDRILDLR